MKPIMRIDASTVNGVTKSIKKSKQRNVIAIYCCHTQAIKYIILIINNVLYLNLMPKMARKAQHPYKELCIVKMISRPLFERCPS